MSIDSDSEKKQSPQQTRPLVDISNRRKRAETSYKTLFRDGFGFFNQKQKQSFITQYVFQTRQWLTVDLVQ